MRRRHDGGYDGYEMNEWQGGRMNAFGAENVDFLHAKNLFNVNNLVI